MYNVIWLNVLYIYMYDTMQDYHYIYIVYIYRKMSKQTIDKEANNI